MDQYQYFFIEKEILRGKTKDKKKNLKWEVRPAHRTDAQIITVNNRLKRIYGYNKNKNQRDMKNQKKIWHDYVLELDNIHAISEQFELKEDFVKGFNDHKSAYSYMQECKYGKTETDEDRLNSST